MKVIVGLGNPGAKYLTTRHNIGFLFLDFIARKYEFADFEEKTKLKSLVSEKNIGTEKVLLIKPTTFMNLSGESLLAVKNFYKLEWSDFLICYDDVDLPFGTVRQRLSGSAGTHNGMRSILGISKDDNIPRIKLGIEVENRLGDLSGFVLGRFSDLELSELKDIFENGLAKIDFLP
jgi:PTH1 family peptidyl-tRNA hydrolase